MSFEGANSQRGASFFGLPTAALAALPACPACYPLYAGLLSSLGLTALIDPTAEATWENAGDHIVSWGSTVNDKADQLFGNLERLPKRPSRPTDK